MAAISLSYEPKADGGKVNIEAERSDEFLALHDDEARGVHRRKLVKIAPLEIAPAFR